LICVIPSGWMGRKIGMVSQDWYLCKLKPSAMW
jgi:hypothetical protein